MRETWLTCFVRLRIARSRFVVSNIEIFGCRASRPPSLILASGRARYIQRWQHSSRKSLCKPTYNDDWRHSIVVFTTPLPFIVPLINSVQWKNKTIWIFPCHNVESAFAAGERINTTRDMTWDADKIIRRRLSAFLFWHIFRTIPILFLPLRGQWSSNAPP